MLPLQIFDSIVLHLGFSAASIPSYTTLSKATSADSASAFRGASVDGRIKRKGKYPLTPLGKVDQIRLYILEQSHGFGQRERAFGCAGMVAHSGVPLRWSSRAIDSASTNGHLHILRWWISTGLDLQYKYSCHALAGAEANGHLNLLES
ncbi:hypothetical protein BJ742DRAFT_74218 [Cladochytrium replicatum]|nr:hypothetical protein BJ742DRAFT_74218 [Cladochytrium replicatum]